MNDDRLLDGFGERALREVFKRTSRHDEPLVTLALRGPHLNARLSTTNAQNSRHVTFFEIHAVKRECYPEN
jgi:hypothetical protein